MMKALFKASTWVAGLALAGPVFAHAGGDLMIYNNGTGGLSFGLYDFDGGSGVVLDPGPIQIIEAELEQDWESTGQPGIAEPGWTTDGSAPADPTTPTIEYGFPANTALTITGNLLPGLGANAAYWDGSGAVSFTAALPNAVEVEDAFGALVFDGLASAPAGSISPWISGGDGTAHDHLEFLLDAPDATAASGVYLISLSASAGDLGSEPLYVLLGYAGSDFTDEQLEVAIELAEVYVETYIVPEPASLALIGLGLAPLMRRRR